MLPRFSTTQKSPLGINVVIPSTCSLKCNVSAEKTADDLMKVPLYVTNRFSLAASKILSLRVGLVAQTVKSLPAMRETWV